MNRRALLGTLALGPVALAAAREADPDAPKVLMPLGDASEAMDTLYPFFRVAEDGYRAVVAGPDVRLYHMVLHEIPPAAGIPWDITEERPGYHIQAEIAFRDVKPEEYAGLFVSGGRAPEYLRYDKDLLRITRHFFEAGKPVAVVCHGIEIVSAAGVIRGKTVTTVAKCALDCDKAGPNTSISRSSSMGTWSRPAPGTTAHRSCGSSWRCSTPPGDPRSLPDSCLAEPTG